MTDKILYISNKIQSAHIFVSLYHQKDWHIMVLEYFLSYSFIKMEKWGHISFLSFWICKRLLRKIEHKHITKYLNLSKLSISDNLLCIALCYVICIVAICKSLKSQKICLWSMNVTFIYVYGWMHISIPVTTLLFRSHFMLFTHVQYRPNIPLVSDTFTVGQPYNNWRDIY